MYQQIQNRTRPLAFFAPGQAPAHSRHDQFSFFPFPSRIRNEHASPPIHMVSISTND